MSRDVDRFELSPSSLELNSAFCLAPPGSLWKKGAVPLSEADMYLKFVVPKLQPAGWRTDAYCPAELRHYLDAGGRLVPTVRGKGKCQPLNFHAYA